MALPQVKTTNLSRDDNRSKLSHYLMQHGGLAKTWSWVSGVLHLGDLDLKQTKLLLIALLP